MCLSYLSGQVFVTYSDEPTKLPRRPREPAPSYMLPCLSGRRKRFGSLHLMRQWSWTLWSRSSRAASQACSRSGCVGVKGLERWWPSPHLSATLEETRQEVAEAVLVVAALRRMGATPPLLRKLQELPKPDSFTRFLDVLACQAYGLWRLGQHACTEAYFPAVCGHGREKTSRANLAQKPEEACGTALSMARYYKDLAPGTGCWETSNGLQGPAAPRLQK